jgi:type I restriction enzyme R subunit
MLAESGAGGADDDPAPADGVSRAGALCALAGRLDREAAKEALAGFLAGKTLAANQIEFVNLIVDHLTEQGVMDPALLYESPSPT